MKSFVFIAILIAAKSALAQPYGQWGEPINLGPPINSENDERNPTLDASGNKLALLTSRPNPSLGGIFTSNLINGQWSELQYVFPIGSPANLSPALSPNGNEIYFSCYCGGYGDYDIWKVIFDSTLQRWSDPINLGPNINDSFGQSDPFLSYDGQKLYFINSSMRFVYPGLVVSHRDGDGWSYPEWVSDHFIDAENASLTMDENTAYFEKDIPPRGLLVLFSAKDSSGNWSDSVQFDPINNSQRGFYPRVSPDGNTIYYCSNRTGGYGLFDIWQINKIPQGIHEDVGKLSNRIIVYPNPSNGQFHIQIAGDVNDCILIYDILGRELLRMQARGNRNLIWPKSERSMELNSGLYFIILKNQEGQIINIKKAILLK